MIPSVRLKILVIGEHRSGKSSFVKAYRLASEAECGLLGLSFESDKFSPEYDSTTGVDIRKGATTTMRSGDGSLVRVVPTFFDLSGDLSYLKVRTEFYQDYQAALLLFDVTSKDSFDRLDYWVKEATKFGTEKLPPVLLVANKIDLRSQRVVTEKDARAFAELHGFDYCETSAKTAYGIKNGVDSLLSVYIQDSKGHQDAGSFNRHNTSQGAANATSRPGTSNHSQQAQPNARQSTPVSSTNLEEWSVKDLKRELTRRQVPHDDCVEKKDLIARLQSTMREADEKDAEAKQKRDQELAAERIQQEVEEWSRGKDIRSMLNDILKYAPDNPNYLERHATLAPVTKAYKKSMLKIHPDKVGVDDFEAHVRATEMFKMVNSAFQTFKKANERRMSSVT